MREVRVLLHRDFAIGATDRRLFGAFVEHLGRCVYGGIFEPGHPQADERGFRKDVLALVRELAPTIMRYPGGNFVSGYNWEDGVGPVDNRPRRLDLAWKSTETTRFGHVEFISLHTYLNNYAGDTAAFLASSDLMDSFIDEVVAIADAVAAHRRSTKRIMLSFDEWNVWYRTRRNRETRVLPNWPVAPHILEEVYTMEDALAFGGACISLLNHADRVKAACLAQLVNAIAPIMTEDGGAAWRQTIFFPFAQMSRYGRGRVLRIETDTPTYETRYFDPRGSIDQYYPLPKVPYLKLAAVHDAEAKSLTLFALNRHLGEELPLEVKAEGFAGLA